MNYKMLNKTKRNNTGSSDGENSSVCYSFLPPSLPPGRYGIAAFDYDGTLIDEGGNISDSMLSFVRETAKTHIIVIFSNQLNSYALMKVPGLASLLNYFDPFVNQLGINISVFASIANDIYRKPEIGMFTLFTSLLAEIGYTWDKAQSFFCGDAAGRPGDFSCSDRKFAYNADIQFITPDLRNDEAFSWGTISPSFLSSFPKKDSFTWTPPVTQEILLLVGVPGSGKSSFCQRHLVGTHVRYSNDDNLSERQKKEIIDRTIKSGRSLVIDNTNVHARHRKRWIDLSNDTGIPIRVIMFTTPLALAKHLSVVRMRNGVRERIDGAYFLLKGTDDLSDISDYETLEQKPFIDTSIPNYSLLSDIGEKPAKKTSVKKTTK